MEEADEFIEKFHNLEGVLLKEKKKSLFLLLERYKSFNNNEELLTAINEKLVPKTYLEEIYKIEVLIYFRRASDLLDILKNGHAIAASKIIRQPWFMQALFQNMTSAQFVQDIFPQLSIVVRSKILNQMLKQFKDEHVINSYFDELLETYGMKPALILLPGCSTDKIREFLMTRWVTLSPPKLKLLHDKDPTLIRFFHEEFYRRGGNMIKLKDFHDYLSKKNPKLYVELLLKYKFYGTSLGRQATRIWVTENKEVLIKEPRVYLDLNIFHKPTLVKALGKDFPEFLKALFPARMMELLDFKAHNLLDDYPKKKRYELYSNTFQAVYGKDLLTMKAFMTHNLLEVISDDDLREKWVETFENNVDYIKYKRSTLAVPELKEQLTRCDDMRFRKTLFQDLVTTCSISKDYDGILDILKLVCARYQNTDITVLNGLLEEIHNKIKLEELNEEHWKYIHEIISGQDVRNNSLYSLMVFEYCRFLYKSEKSFEDIIPIYLRSNYFGPRTLEYKNEKFRDDNFQKEFLTLIVKYFSLNKKLQEDVWANSELVLAVKEWNDRHPNDTITISEQKDIVDVIKKAVSEDWVYSKSSELLSMNYLVCHENLLEEFTDIYFNNLKTLENATLSRWLLKYKPSVFEEHISEVSKCRNIKTRQVLMTFLKKYEHTGLIQKLTKHYLDELKDPEFKDKDKTAGFLASIMSDTSFSKLLEDQVPTKLKIDVINATDEEKNTFRIQSALAKCVRLRTCQVDTLPYLLEYCKGDYFQSALYSLYSCFNKTPEKTLQPVLDNLLKSAVSVRKHAIFLSALAFPINCYDELGKKILATERNDSIQKHLFSSSFKYFLKNPLKPIWDILQKYMSHLTLHEIESLILLTDINNVAEEYRGEFTEKVWELYENLEKTEKKSTDMYRDKLMENIKDVDIKFLSTELCVKMIDQKLFKEKYKQNNACVKFAIKFMMYGNDIKENVQAVMKILEKYKENYWSSKYKIFANSVVYRICMDIFNRTMHKRELRVFLPVEFCQIISEEWKKLFTLQENFEEHLMLDLMVLKYGHSKDLSYFAGKINTIFEALRSTYNDLIVKLFANFLSWGLKPLLGEKNYNKKLIKFLSYFYKENSSLPACLIIIQLLPSYESDSEFKKDYVYLTKELQNKGEIQAVYLNNYYKNKTEY